MTIQATIFSIVNDSGKAGILGKDANVEYAKRTGAGTSNISAHLKFLFDDHYVSREYVPPVKGIRGQGSYRYFATVRGLEYFGLVSPERNEALAIEQARETMMLLNPADKKVLFALNGGEHSPSSLTKVLGQGQTMPSLQAITQTTTGLTDMGLIERDSEYHQFRITEEGRDVVKQMVENPLTPFELAVLMAFDEGVSMLGHLRISIESDNKTKAPWAQKMTETQFRDAWSSLREQGFIANAKSDPSMIAYLKLTETGKAMQDKTRGIAKPQYEIIPTMDAQRLYFAVRNDGAVKAVAGSMEVEFTPADTELLYNLLSNIHGKK